MCVEPLFGYFREHEELIDKQEVCQRVMLPVKMLSRSNSGIQLLNPPLTARRRSL